jgi:transcriptional regulator with XRE-family HTH domain
LCNISHTTLDNIEKGIDFRTGKPTQVKMVTLLSIANAAGVPVSFIIGEETNDQLPTTEATHKLITLFNQLPPESQEKAIPLIEAALKAVGLLK